MSQGTILDICSTVLSYNVALSALNECFCYGDEKDLSHIIARLQASLIPDCGLGCLRNKQSTLSRVRTPCQIGNTRLGLKVDAITGIVYLFIPVF